MSDECFEDPEIARILNENFICIKVDREERPDVDEVYMKAVQAMTGQGGWPLSVFLTPDLQPFYGGTYFPPESRHGLPGFKQVLQFISRAWRERRGELVSAGREVMRALKEMYSFTPVEGPPDGSVLEACFDNLVMLYDEAHGGFGAAPKFPMPSYIFFLLRYYKWRGEGLALKMACRTLHSMARGGIRDQVGGGFHRYATDRAWVVPHFEKMLYDNALLAKAYLEAYQATHDPNLLDVAEDTLAWALRELRHGEGGFYTALDADSEGGEGAFYVWRQAEVYEALGREDGELACKYFGITPDGNFERGTNILRVAREPASLAEELGLPEARIRAAIARIRGRLLEYRGRRPRPALDDKILTSWNGLMISTLAYAHQITGNPTYLRAAEESAGFILTRLQRDGRLLRRYRGGEAAIPGMLEDYAFFIMGLIDLYEATFDERWLGEALRLNQQCIQLFWDREGGGFFLNIPEPGGLEIRVKEAYDGAIPSPNSVQALNLLRIAELTADEGMRRLGERTILTFWRSIEAHPTAHTQMLAALHFLLAGPKQVVVAGHPQSPETQLMLREVHRHYIPNKVLVLSNPDKTSSLIPYLQDKTPREGRPAVYICQNYSCSAPICDLHTLREALSSLR